MERDQAMSVREADSLHQIITKAGSEYLKKRLGAKTYARITDTAYQYPHYYRNVYFNKAPMEKNYRYYQRFKFANDRSYELELRVDPKKAQVLDPVEAILPDCKKHPERCQLLGTVEALEKLKALTAAHSNTEGSLNFYFNNMQQRFEYVYTIREMQEYPYGKTVTVYMDAATGKPIDEIQVQNRVYLGR